MPDKADGIQYSDKLFYRSEELSERALSKDGTISMIFSTETEVKRWFGTEILSHHAKHVNLGRARSLLFNHDPNRIIGPLSDVRIDKGKGLASASFDVTEEGQVAMERVKSGSLKGVSVGYRVDKFRKLEADEEFVLANGKTIKGGAENNPTYIAEKWQPIEASLTPIPADVNSKVGRDAIRSLDGIEIINESSEGMEDATQRDEGKTNTGGENMDTKVVKEKDATPGGVGGTEPATPEGGENRTQAAPVYEPATRDVDVQVQIRAALDGQREELVDMLNRCEGYGPVAVVTAVRAIVDGKPMIDAMADVMAGVAKQRGVPTDAGDGSDSSGKGKSFMKGTDDKALARALGSPQRFVDEGGN